jgi:transcriptional regulator with XRE-family HTH domain
MDIARHELTAEDIGVRLRAVRELSGLSVSEVSKASGVSRRELHAAEHGRRVLDSSAMRAVAGALGVSPSVLVSVSPQALPDDSDFVDDDITGARIDSVAGHDPGHWHDMPASPDDLPAPIPFDLPASERRINGDTRADLEGSWVAVRNEMYEVIETATRLAMCGSSDDPIALMRNVEFEIDKLKRKRGFQRHVARHQAEVLKARAADHRPTDPAA